MNDQVIKQLNAIADELASILERRVRVGASYAREFAQYSAGYAASLIRSPDPDGLDEFRAQARVIIETVDELGDQATDQVLDVLEDGIHILLAVGRAAI